MPNATVLPPRSAEPSVERQAQPWMAERPRERGYGTLAG
jgi:hypothetical protein